MHLAIVHVSGHPISTIDDGKENLCRFLAFGWSVCASANQLIFSDLDSCVDSGLLIFAGEFIIVHSHLYDG